LIHKILVSVLYKVKQLLKRKKQRVITGYLKRLGDQSPAKYSFLFVQIRVFVICQLALRLLHSKPFLRTGRIGQGLLASTKSHGSLFLCSFLFTPYDLLDFSIWRDCIVFFIIKCLYFAIIADYHYIPFNNFRICIGKLQVSSFNIFASQLFL